MAFYIVNHKVEDFKKWKKVYDEFESTRIKHRVLEHYALQSVDDSNHVLVVGEGSLDSIKKYLDSEELKAGMAAAGIASAPEIFVGENKK